MATLEPSALPALRRAVVQAVCSFLHAATAQPPAAALLQQGLGELARARLHVHGHPAAWAWLGAAPPPSTPSAASQTPSLDVCTAVVAVLQGLERLPQDDACRASLLDGVLYCLPAVAGGDAALDQRVAQLARACVSAVHDAGPCAQAAVAAHAHALTDARVLAALQGGGVQGRAAHKHLELLVKVRTCW